MQIRSHTAAATALFIAGTAFGQANVFQPGDDIWGVQVVNSDINVAGEGFSGNNAPPGEGAEHAIDGVGQKYLNFGKENTGILVTPSRGSSIAESITFWTANDEEPRDPSSFELWGTNAAIAGPGPFDLGDFTQMVAFPLVLPSSRNDGGDAPLLASNSQTVFFSNTDAYTSYLVVFPTLKDSANANSMQIAEVQLNVPAPGALSLLAIGALASRRRGR